MTPSQGSLFGNPWEVPAEFRDTVRIGTCSWKYDSWKGLVYEKGTKYHADDYLVDYSRHFSTVEVDQWFWSLFPGEVVLPRRETVETYAASVPANFMFTVKAPNAITLTHYYAKQPPQFSEWRGKPNDAFLSVDLAKRFLDTLGPLHSRLGPVMFQFEYLNSKKMPSRDIFYDRIDGFLGSLPRGFQYAVELRNPDYLGREWVDMLRSRGAGVVLLDGYHMPPPVEVTRANDVATAPYVVVRLHGPDREGIEAETGKKWNRVVQPREKRLRETAEMVRDFARRNIRVFVNVNNHYEGSAPLTIGRFLDALRKSTQE